MTRTKLKRGLAAAGIAVAIGSGAAPAALADNAPAEFTPITAGATKATGGLQVHGGQAIVMVGKDGKTLGRCTLTTTARDGAGVQYGVTSGHCLNPKSVGSEVAAVKTIDGRTIAAGAELSRAVVRHTTQPNIGITPRGIGTGNINDIAFFPLAPGVHGAPIVDSQITTGFGPADRALGDVSRVVTPPRKLGAAMDVSQLKPGQLVYKDGAMTSRTAGVVLSVNPGTAEVTALIPTIAGDSGSPLYVVDGKGVAHIVGNLSGGSPVLFNAFDGTRTQLAQNGLHIG